MVKFLLQAGADQEHKTDEMHTALMEASMVSIFLFDEKIKAICICPVLSRTGTSKLVLVL